MKKSLIALAVLAVSGAAFAQSNVTLYGIADVVVHKDKNVSAKMTSGGVSSSRWGVKGSEDLGGGLKANFNFEQKVDVTTGAASGFGRQANVGFSGGFGVVKLGKTWNAYDDMAGASNDVFDSVLSSARIAPSSNNYNGNPDQGVYYASPTMGGFSGALGTSFKAGSDNLRVSAFNVLYNGGPVYVGLGYENQSGDVTSVKNTRLNGSYDLGAAKILAAYGQHKEAGADSKDFSIGVDVPLSPALVMSAGYTQVRPDAGGDKPNSFAVGANYSLSKRTSVYGGFRKDNDAAYGAAYGGVGSRFGVGVKHTF